MIKCFVHLVVKFVDQSADIFFYFFFQGGHQAFMMSHAVLDCILEMVSISKNSFKCYYGRCNNQQEEAEKKKWREMVEKEVKRKKRLREALRGLRTQKREQVPSLASLETKRRWRGTQNEMFLASFWYEK